MHGVTISVSHCFGRWFDLKAVFVYALVRLLTYEQLLNYTSAMNGVKISVSHCFGRCSDLKADLV